jgi:polyisoprenoid-binding protein YceI
VTRALRLDSEGSKLELWTYKEGLLSGVAHDLCFRAEGLQLSAEVDDDGAVSVEVVVPVERLQLRGQVKKGHVSPMKPKDAADVHKNLTSRRVLDAGAHPQLRYVGRGTPQGDRIELAGELTLRGTSRPLALQATWREEASHVQVEGEVRFAQSRWGIKPFSALMGSLRVRDELRVSWGLRFEG